MDLLHDLQNRLIERFGRVVDLKQNPAVLAAIAEEVRQAHQPGGAASAAPFGVSWMDSWVAHWIYEENLRSAASKDRQLATLMRALVDIRFSARLGELQLFVRQHLGGNAEPPDGGPPEPGAPPPAGPVAFDSDVRDPVLEPEPPDGGAPEPGTPLPPDPGPDPGPEHAFLGENPWILYWFVSLKAPELLRIIDAHFNRRLDELSTRKGRSRV
jgi:hypothetical protein